jgi:hypothetical protein
LRARLLRALVTAPPPSHQLVWGYSRPTTTPWSEGTTAGAWTLRFNGYGSARILQDRSVGSPVLEESPAVAQSAGETHSTLVTSTASLGDFDMTVPVRTQAQLRLGTQPNPWEVGWVLWHYRDNTHFYYFIARPDGWELGKENPAYPGNQDFLLSGSTPTFPLGSWYSVRVREVGGSMAVWVNGALICTYVDRSNPYLSGAIGLYDEDAAVHFAPVVVAYGSAVN